MANPFDFLGDLLDPLVQGVDSLFGPGQTGAPQALQAPQQPFAPTVSPGATSPQDFERFENAISSIESPGTRSRGYQLRGPIITRPSSPYFGDRAYGRFQVMGRDIPRLTMQFTGRRLTPEEFLASPEAQHQVFRGQFGAYLQRFGNPVDAAQAWFAGPNSVGDPTALDRNDTQPGSHRGISVREYRRRFEAFLGQSGMTTGALTSPGIAAGAPGGPPLVPTTRLPVGGPGSSAEAMEGPVGSPRAMGQTPGLDGFGTGGVPGADILAAPSEAVPLRPGSPMAGAMALGGPPPSGQPNAPVAPPRPGLQLADGPWGPGTSLFGTPLDYLFGPPVAIGAQRERMLNEERLIREQSGTMGAILRRATALAQENPTMPQNALLMRVLGDREVISHMGRVGAQDFAKLIPDIISAIRPNPVIGTVGAGSASIARDPSTGRPLPGTMVAQPASDVQEIERIIGMTDQERAAYLAARRALRQPTENEAAMERLLAEGQVAPGLPIEEQRRIANRILAGAYFRHAYTDPTSLESVFVITDVGSGRIVHSGRVRAGAGQAPVTGAPVPPPTTPPPTVQPDAAPPVPPTGDTLTPPDDNLLPNRSHAFLAAGPLGAMGEALSGLFGNVPGMQGVGVSLQAQRAHLAVIHQRVSRLSGSSRLRQELEANLGLRPGDSSIFSSPMRATVWHLGLLDDLTRRLAANQAMIDNPSAHGPQARRQAEEDNRLIREVVEVLPTRAQMVELIGQLRRDELSAPWPEFDQLIRVPGSVTRAVIGRVFREARTPPTTAPPVAAPPVAPAPPGGGGGDGGGQPKAPIPSDTPKAVGSLSDSELIGETGTASGPRLNAVLQELQRRAALKRGAK